MKFNSKEDQQALKLREIKVKLEAIAIKLKFYRALNDAIKINLKN